MTSEEPTTVIRDIWYGATYQCEHCHEICHVPPGCNGPFSIEQAHNAFFKAHIHCDRPKLDKPLYERYPSSIP